MSSRTQSSSFVQHIRKTETSLSDQVTRFCGSFTFVILHALWFSAWIGFNELSPGKGFDPFPFGLLTMIVSLEAIFLSTFVLISQNRDAKTANLRALADYQTNVYAEVLSQLTAERLGVDLDQVEAIAQQRLRDSDVDGTPAGKVMPAPPGGAQLRPDMSRAPNVGLAGGTKDATKTPGGEEPTSP